MGSRKTDRLEHLGRFYDHVPTPPSRTETIFRHSHWETRRERIISIMRRALVNDFRLLRFESCGSDAIVEWSEQLQKHRVRANYCHDRHCEPCMRAKANKIARNLQEKISDRPHVRHRFITLTLQHSDDPLRDQIATLYRSFRKLRSSPLWKKTQDGGAFFLEVKRDINSPANKQRIRSGLRPQWHPHLHIVSAGRYLNGFDLSAAWLKSTGTSRMVDIRLLRDAREAVHYVTKYITKSTSPDVWRDDEAAAEWLCASRGVRTCSTFGTWRKFRLTQSPPDPKDWVRVDTLQGLIDRVTRGERAAQDLMLLLRPPGSSDTS